MRSSAWLLLACAACGGSDDDAPPVEGPCSPDVSLYGELLDWDAVAGSFAGVPGAVWTVEGETSRTAVSAPNGRVELCVAPEERSRIAIASPDPHLDGHYAADADLFADATRTFELYLPTAAQLAAQYATFDAGLAPDPAKGHVLVEVQGTAGTPILTGTAAAAVRYLTEAGTWSEVGPARYALFMNVEPGTGTVAMPTADGGGTVPVTAGAWTMTTLVAP